LTLPFAGVATSPDGTPGLEELDVGRRLGARRQLDDGDDLLLPPPAEFSRSGRRRVTPPEA
jgi:hypothetical protein